MQQVAVNAVDIRPDAQGILVGLDGVVHTSGRAEDVAACNPGFGKIRIDGQRCLKFLQGLLRIRVRKCSGKSQPRLRKFWISARGLIECALCIVYSAARSKNITATDPSLGR